MSVTDSSPARQLVTWAWALFAVINAALMYALPGEETIPYHLIWASFALLYGLQRWSVRATWVTFSLITVVTGIALIEHAQQAIIGWEECSEIVLMGILVALLVWHVRRFQSTHDRLLALRESERQHAEQREVAARFGSHEVRTRLTIARGFTELIRDRSSDATTFSDAGVVLSELDKASALATMLLTLVRVESPSARVPLDLTELVETVLNRWSAAAQRTWRGHSEVGRMLGDPERLEAALDCLIENAVKFTEPGDEISVSARQVDGVVRLSVADTGVGIPPEQRQRVTELFNTGAATGAKAGSGLGLAIVRAIVEARGGGLEIEPNAGRGTRITMSIPGAHPTARGNRLAAGAATAARSTTPSVEAEAITF